MLRNRLNAVIELKFNTQIRTLISDACIILTCGILLVNVGKKLLHFVVYFEHSIRKIWKKKEGILGFVYVWDSI